MTQNAGQDAMLPYLKSSPYSMKVIHALREMARRTNDPIIINAVNKPLKSHNRYLYYKIIPENTTQLQAINQWVQADSCHILLPIPIDSISMYPHLFPQSVIDQRSKEKKVFYTTVAATSPLPQGMNGILLDSLYVPDNTEFILEFLANLYTANMSNNFITKLKDEVMPFYDVVNDVDSNKAYMKFKIVAGESILDDTWYGESEATFHRTVTHFVPAANDYDGVTSGGGKVTTINTGGRITFKEQTLGINEGIRDLGVIAMRFILPPVIRRTDADGRFTSTMPSYGHVGLIYIFMNNQLKIRSIDFSGTILGDIASAIHYHTSIFMPEYYAKLVDPFSNVNNVNTHFLHGTKHALWGITFNAVQEANGYAAMDGIYDFSPVNSRFLNVMCYYNNTNTASSAPMLGYISASPLGTGITNIIFHTMGLTSLYGSTIGGYLPDMLISQAEDSIVGSADLRQTIYHEYAHTRHYFKANQWTNAHWIANIEKSISSGDGYGVSIDDDPGDFFALSEGWADFLGANYAFRKYGTGVTRTEWNAWTFNFLTGNYNQLLENVPTFFNAFIPRGLFHDLIDNNTSEEFAFDRIQGHTIQQIYNRFNDNTWTIQQFRDRWEDAFPSVNNNLLFNQYNIN